MKRRIFISIPLILILSFSFYCKKKVAPGEEAIENMLKLIPQNAIGLAFLNVQKIANTEFFDKVTTQKPEDSKKYQEFIKKWGIDPKKDLYYVAFGVIGETLGKEAEGVGIGMLNYNKDLILTNLKKEGLEIQEEKYDGVTIYGGIDKKNEKTKMVFLDENHIAIGTEGSLKAVVDLYKGKGKSVLKNEKLNSLIKNLKQDAFLWGSFLIPKKAMEGVTSKNPQAKIFESIESASFFVDYENQKYSGELNLFSADETKNKQIVDFLNGVKAMIGMGKNQRPEVQELLQNIKISSTPTKINFGVELTEDLLMRLRKTEEKD